MGKLGSTPHEGGGKLHGKGIYAMEKHQVKFGKLMKIKGFVIEDEFIPAHMTKDEACNLMDSCEYVYPPDRWHQSLREYYKRYYTQEVPELGCVGCFTRKEIKVGDLIGIYAGNKTDIQGEYVMAVANKWIEGKQERQDVLFMMSKINDWYWGGDQQNCRLNEGGVITATRNIKKHEQLCMSYGSEYNWDGVKMILIKQLPKLLTTLASELKIYVYDTQLNMMRQWLEAIDNEWRNRISSGKLGELIINYVDGMPEEVMHDYTLETTESDTFEQWTERVLRSRGWNKRFSFYTWKRWETENWQWIYDKRIRREHKRARKCHKEYMEWIENKDIEQLIPLNEEAARRHTGIWTTFSISQTNTYEEDTMEEHQNDHGEEYSNLRVVFYNVGGFSEAQEIEMLHIIKTHRIAYAILIDARVTEERLRYIRKRVRMVAGPQFRVAAVCSKAKTTPAQRIGGQLHIYRVDTITNLKFYPEDKRGALVYADFKYGSTNFRILAVYMPHENGNVGSMWMELGGNDAHRMLYSTMKMRIKEAKEDNWNIILGGDFNSELEGTMRTNIQDMEMIPTGNLEEPSWRNAVSATRIDHIFYSGEQISQAWGGPREMVSVLTDHLPVFGMYTVLTTVKEVQSISFQLQPDLKRHDVRACAAISTALENMGARTEPREDITLIQQTTVNAYRAFLDKRSGRMWVDGWSPDMMAMQYALRALIIIRRHIRGERKCKVWTSLTMTKGRSNIMHRWKNQLTHLANTKPETAFMTLTKYMEQHEYVYAQVKEMTDQDLRKNIQLLICAVRKQTHGRIRLEQRVQISDRIRKREENREAGKLRPVLESMLGPFRKRREAFTMETLRVEHEIKADPEEIHDILTENFDKWFADPECGARHWDLTDKDDFMERNSQMEIPGSVSELLWESLQDRTEVDEDLANTPTFEEFSKTIDYMSKDSAPGMSGLSYNMMRTWKEEVRKRIYEDICDLWEQGTFPSEWSQRWIVPIPKKTDPDVGDLRPLMLMEALRKVWGTIFVRRIQSRWKAKKLLQPNQYGSVPGKGTDGAVFEFLNAAETARERKTPIYVTSWDIRRAFDSVAKPLVSLALKRLGVPTKLRDYIVNVDKGLSVVRTPWALHCKRHGETARGFEGQRGIGQGDVTSPLIWTALFDILLTALDKIPGGIATCARQGELCDTPDIGYADDLISVQGDLVSLQLKADIVSGFCIWAGLTLATDKFRAFAINWGNQFIDMGTHILIHGKGWTATEVQMRTDGNLKHLGVLWDMDLGNNTQRAQTEDFLKEALAYILARRASARCKVIAITKCVIPKLLYVLKFMGWTLEQYEQLERQISSTLRQVAKHIRGFPTDLLYVSRDDGGMGFDSLVDIVHRTKHRMYQRLCDDGDSHHAANSLLARAFRAKGQVLQPNQEAVLQPGQWISTVWATSLVEWMEREEQQLVATGKAGSQGTEDDIAQGLTTGLYTKEEREGGEVRMRTGQFWTHEQYWERSSVLEIIGVSEDQVHGIVWNTEHNVNISIGATLITTPATHGEGGGPMALRGHPMEVLEDLGSNASLLSVTADRHCKQSNQPINKCTVMDIVTRQIRAPLTRMTEETQLKNVEDVYTDGTYMCSGTMVEWAQGAPVCTVAAGVVVNTDEGTFGYRITDMKMESAYDAELVAIAAAGRLAPGAPIYTDCKSAMQTAQGTQHRTGMAHTLVIASRRGTINKVQAHAERRKHKRDWTRQEDGNVLADAVAAGRGEEVGLTMKKFNISEAINNVLPFVWKGSDGHITMGINKTRRCKRYVAQRDKWRARAESPRGARWTGTTSCLGGGMWKKQDCSWAQAVRIMWDKHVTGENQIKWKCKETLRCEVCGAVLSQKHIILECQRPGAAAIRSRAIDKVQRIADGHGHSLVGRTIRAVLKLQKHDEAQSIWTGLWTPAIRNAICEECPWQLTRREYGMVVAALRHLASGVLELYRQGRVERRRRERTEDKMETRQPTVAECWTGEDKDHREQREQDEREHDARKYDR